MRFLLVVMLLGCRSSTPSAQLPAAVSPSPASAIGKPCAGDADCASGSCITDAKWPGGYCTVRGCGECGPDADCSGRSGIGAKGCFKKCNGPADCRAGYHCCPDANSVKVCVPPGAGQIGC